MHRELQSATRMLAGANRHSPPVSARPAPVSHPRHWSFYLGLLFFCAVFGGGLSTMLIQTVDAFLSSLRRVSFDLQANRTAHDGMQLRNITVQLLRANAIRTHSVLVSDRLKTRTRDRWTLGRVLYSPKHFDHYVEIQLDADAVSLQTQQWVLAHEIAHIYHWQCAPPNDTLSASRTAQLEAKIDALALYMLARTCTLDPGVWRVAERDMHDAGFERASRHLTACEHRARAYARLFCASGQHLAPRFDHSLCAPLRACRAWA